MIHRRPSSAPPLRATNARAIALGPALALTLLGAGLAPMGGAWAKAEGETTKAHVAGGHKPAKAGAKSKTAKRTPRRETQALPKAEAALARQAFDFAGRGNWTAAHAAARRAHDPILAKLMDYFELIDPNSTVGFDAVTAFARSNPDWPRRGGLFAKAEALMPERMSPQEVIAWFDGQGPVSVQGEARLAAAQIAIGQRDQGVAAIRRAWITRTMTREMEASILADFGDVLTPDDHVQRLDRLIWDEQIEAATRQILRVDPVTQAVARARIALQQEAGNVDTLIARVPEARRDDPGLVYERIRWRRRKDQNDEALALLLRAPQGQGAPLAHADKWWIERHIQARKALAAGDVTNAYLLASSHGNESGVAFAQGEFLSGWLALRHLGQPATALDHFTRLDAATVTPASKSRAAYWAGRAAEALGRADEARRWREAAARYPTTYYGQLAMLDLGRRSLDLPPPPDPSEEQREAFESLELVRALRYLEAAGEDDKARPFIAKLAEVAPTPDSFLLLAEIARIEGRPEIALSIAKEANNRGVILPEHGYPLVAFSNRANRDAGGVEPALVLSISRQESAFNHRAVSPAGALGLMQLMPATAKQMARSLNLRFEKARLTTDPHYNATLGSAFLADLIDSQRGSYILTIAAYNAGPGRTRQWARDFGDPRDPAVDPIDWVERIPFQETRDYVQRVVENLQVYRYRLAGRPVPLSIGEDLRRAQRSEPAGAAGAAAPAGPIAPAGPMADGAAPGRGDGLEKTGGAGSGEP